MLDLLLTGFEPFGGSTVNPSAEVVRVLQTEGLSGLRLHTLVLPVDTQRAPELLRASLLELQPDWCVLLGEARGRAALSIERVAINLLDFRIPDNAGVQPADQAIVPDGPAAYFSTLPVRALQTAVAEAGVPAELSLSAGTYLCNQVAYLALHLAHSQRLPTRCGFIHLPALPQQVAGERFALPSMALETMRRGLRAALAVLDSQQRAP